MEKEAPAIFSVLENLPRGKNAILHFLIIFYSFSWFYILQLIVRDTMVFHILPLAWNQVCWILKPIGPLLVPSTFLFFF